MWKCYISQDKYLNRDALACESNIEKGKGIKEKKAIINMQTSWRLASQMEEIYSWPIACTSHVGKENQRRDSVSCSSEVVEVFRRPDQIVGLGRKRGVQVWYLDCPQFAFIPSLDAHCSSGWLSLFSLHIAVSYRSPQPILMGNFQLTHCSHLSRAYISFWIEASEWV